MAFDINNFKTLGLRYGGARPSLFEVIVYSPTGITLGPGIEKFPFVCRAAELPESTIGNIEIPYFGRKIKVAGERSFADWTVTVMNDEDFAVRTMFEAWHNSINTIVSNLRLASPDDNAYKSNVDVNQYAKDGELVRSYQLVGAFPTQVSGITLGWDSANAIEEFTVNFSYDYWVPVTIGTTILSAKTSGQVTEYDVEATPTGGPVGV